MSGNRYLKFILTVIALELGWLVVRESAPPALAQQQPQQPAAVVITGFRIAGQDYPVLPVAVAGGLDSSSALRRDLPFVEPLKVQMSDPVRLDARQQLTVQIGNQPLTVQTGTRPLSVESVPARPGLKPGL